MKAWERGLKGITIFRDGCKRIGILSTSSHEDDDNDESSCDPRYTSEDLDL